MCFFYGFSMMNYPWKELSRANTHQRVKEMVLGDWRTAAVKWNTTGEKTGKAEIVRLALQASFKISMKECICLVYRLCLEFRGHDTIEKLR